MPWHAVPFDDSEGRARLRSLYRRFRVSSLPHIVLLEDNGRVLNPQAYSSMLADPLGFPWPKKDPLQLLGDKLIDNKGEAVDPSSLAGKTVGIYFSASWCGPCRNFTPKLSETVKKLRERGEPVEVVFVSNDRDEESFKNYFSKMDWLAVPFSRTATRALAQDALGVRSLPTLIWVSPRGEILTRRGVSAILRDGEGAQFPWKEKPVRDIDEALEIVAEEPVVLAFLDLADEETQRETLKVLEEVAVSLKATETGTSVGPVPQFLTAKGSSPRTSALRHICKEGLSPSSYAKSKVSLLILDIYSQKVYAFPHGNREVTKENVLEFVTKFRNDELEGKPITLPETRRASYDVSYGAPPMAPGGVPRGPLHHVQEAVEYYKAHPSFAFLHLLAPSRQGEGARQRKETHCLLPALVPLSWYACKLAVGIRVPSLQGRRA
ncbi:nucleoredoxin, putative [Eimeria necatrix]|uniref:Nucleoredoxin, putative n=1 Tax=Eimeria necatrix TaxID=51315 RepID=U6MVA0_9EIME|nr:nucleoredoxin, putative [Eimeria necatrix]CDJ68127.1 nucleoredoxin, putative [Eimeria necatrix]